MNIADNMRQQVSGALAISEMFPVSVEGILALCDEVERLNTLVRHLSKLEEEQSIELARLRSLATSIQGLSGDGSAAEPDS